MNSWIPAPAGGDYLVYQLPGASRAGTVERGEGASSPSGDAWLRRPGRSRSLQAAFTGPPPVVHLAGDIDEWTYPCLTEVLARASAARQRRVKVDLAGVRYCDVAGLRAIISLAGTPGDGRDAARQIVLAHLPVPLQAVLRILGWDTTPGVILEGCTG